MTNLSCACTSYTFAFASTWWVIKQYEKTLKAKSDKNTDATSIEFMSLEQVFNTDDGFEVFANHLVNEFSTENLFFVLEMMQIKNQIQQNKSLKVNNVGLRITVCKEILDEFCRDDAKIIDLDTFRMNIMYIMNEYIYDYSEHSVNISAPTRHGIIKIFDVVMESMNKDGKASVTVNSNRKSVPTLTGVPSNSVCVAIEMDGMEHGDDQNFVDQCIVIFDEALEEVIDLLRRDSLVRFYETPEYKQLASARIDK